ncbi:TlpA family protein disulfide reductase [Ruminiclostridium herbifermentans]|jgi:peroxiredoxin|uniref:TlpA family protein disulfide reductase n=1 Tax=Ruminiclostridium herbifermentans TaxID=2488810 RepID=A0A4U7JIR9_9FIRM|nr:TlpA disulfide reductase family protein [Ruminiclostridium herbifermentans]QNU67219.1 TlpA family protein disulfide reductase [Ruminiclostridium herbifermentans]
MQKKINIIIWVVAICAIMAAAYILYSKNKSEIIIQPPSQQTQELSQSTQNANPVAPDFTLKDLDGNDVKLSDFKGKIVILNFWAVWCKYCLLEMPDFNELNNELGKENDVVILAINSQESPDKVKEYLTSNNIDLKVLLDQDGAVTQTYGITGFPTTFFINKDGNLFTYIPQMTDKKTLLEVIDMMKSQESAQK